MMDLYELCADMVSEMDLSRNDFNILCALFLLQLGHEVDFNDWLKTLDDDDLEDHLGRRGGY